jgi:cytoskeleton protein RodZ
VATGIGETLREARSRRRVDLSEVEAAIKIRVRYLQAMENEEWDALPGGAYTRGFIRTYAGYLGLDGDRLADDYRRGTEPPLGERVPKRVEPVPASARRGGSRLSGRLVIVAVCLILVGAVVAIALTGRGGGGGGSSKEGSPAAKAGAKQRKKQRKQATAAKPGVAVRLAATGEVWICLIDASEKKLVDGQILYEGEEAGPYRSSAYEMAFGNGAVTMYVDGKRADLPESNSPVAYAVDSAGTVSPLEEGERPSCE